MAYYKLVREHLVMFVADKRLMVGKFQFSFSGHNHVKVHNHWHGFIQRFAQTIVCTEENKQHIPQQAKNGLTIINPSYDLPLDLGDCLGQHFSTDEITVEAGAISFRPNDASLLWFIGDRVRGVRLETDKPELFGKSLYVALEPVLTDNESVVHIPMDVVSYESDDKLLGNNYYRLDDGNGCSTIVTM